MAAIKFGVSLPPLYAVYDRRIYWRRQILAKTRNSPNIIARQNLLIYSMCATSRVHCIEYLITVANNIITYSGLALVLTSLAKEVMGLVAFVCLFVCLFVTNITFKKSYERIVIKFYGGNWGGKKERDYVQTRFSFG